MQSDDAGGGRHRRHLLDWLARIGLLPGKEGVGAPSSSNDMAIDLHRYLPFLGEYVLRNRGTDAGNALLEVLRMLLTRRAMCDFNAATKHDEDENEEDELWHRTVTTEEASCVGDGNETGGGLRRLTNKNKIK